MDRSDLASYHRISPLAVCRATVYRRMWPMYCHYLMVKQKRLLIVAGLVYAFPRNLS